MIGIEGTELLIGVDGKTTEVMLFEGQVTVTDNDALPALTLADLTVSEGVGSATVPISISGRFSRRTRRPAESVWRAFFDGWSVPMILLIPKSATLQRIESVTSLRNNVK